MRTGNSSVARRATFGRSKPLPLENRSSVSSKPAASGAWSRWFPWTEGPRIPAHSLAETLDGGQAFRWNRAGAYFEGSWAQFRLRLKPGAGESILCSLPVKAERKAYLHALAEYFNLSTDFDAMADALPWRSDPVLRTALEAFPRLRILCQPVDETLFCFLCSSTKQVPQIKAICESVAAQAGTPQLQGGKALPSWEQIRTVGEDRLRACKLGYRARYIYASARLLAEDPDFFNRLRSMETQAAREALMQLPGVGRKIADCVLLFGLGRHEAFPIDTWIQRILARAYGLNGWSPDQHQQFASAHFGPAAGLAQQYLFAAARAGKILL